MSEHLNSRQTAGANIATPMNYDADVAAYELATKHRYQNPSFAERYLDGYAGGLKLSTFASHVIARREQNCIAKALKTCSPLPAQVLDIPCGTGKLADVLSRHDCQVMAADISMEMMALAKTAYEGRPGFRGFIRCDVTQLPLADESFDTVICLRLIHLIPPHLRRKIINELARVTSRRLIVSYGLASRFQRIRLRLRRMITGRVSAPHPVNFNVAREDFSEAGLKLVSSFSILPLLSCEQVFVLEKVRP
ncbi:class I SAM-dependent methyltransferase [Mesorhizobium sp. CA14]|uniref:class I SAM-dependent methyltransferase n=1 Tax=Mesorhizobium sp. CA14 TaxID=2876642 RepID=UPI001CCE8CD8|nr:class I SAM-dependent methyltransferase [Mesorhizobium sp. CA14]MBZ9849991.1 class I SAM-dependent methyltransferase [Mesorhizobium sp. CA14]